jgi:hypothetical protein
MGERVAPCGIAIGVLALVHEYGFQGAEETLHRCIVPSVWVAAQGSGEGGGLQDPAVIAGGVPAAAVRMVDKST